MNLTTGQNNFIYWIKEGIKQEGSAEALSRTCGISSGTLRKWLQAPLEPPTVIKPLHGKTLNAMKRLSEHLKLKSWLHLFQGPSKPKETSILHGIVREEPESLEVLPAPLPGKPLLIESKVTDLVPLLQKREDIYKTLNTALLVIEGTQDLAKRHTIEGVQERFREVYELYSLANNDMEALKIILDHLAGK